jgi:two-component system phosphate regulon sensor histidine kinase PhoR
VAASLKTRAYHHEVELELKGTNEPLMVRLDPTAMDVALTNLIDNAIKFTPAHGRATIQGYAEDGRILIEVADTGIGIPPDRIEKIFQPFYRIDTSLAATHLGNGVGLALVQHIVQAHDGVVTVQSVPDQGSIFTLTLPHHD